MHINFYHTENFKTKYIQIKTITGVTRKKRKQNRLKNEIVKALHYEVV